MTWRPQACKTLTTIALKAAANENEVEVELLGTAIEAAGAEPWAGGARSDIRCERESCE